MQIGLILSEATVGDAVVQWVVQAGLTVIAHSGMMVRVEGEMSHLADLLHVRFTGSANAWHTADSPVLPPHVVAVSGLSSRGTLHHYHVGMSDAFPVIQTDGPRPGYTPAQITVAYGITQPWDGSGETVGVAEWGSDFSQADLDQFSKQFNLPSVTPRVVNVNNYTPSGSPGVEADLDVQWAHAIAPGAAMVVYNAPPGSTYSAFALEVSALLNEVIADKNRPHVLSISYGNAEASFHTQDLLAWEKLIHDLTNLDVTVLVASGDQGVYGYHMAQWPQTRNATAPATCPHALAVGGTSLFLNGTTFETEWAWSNAFNFGASGGGASAVFNAPAWQLSTRRTVPDLSAVADPSAPCIMAYQGQWVTIGGTSLATPVVAGLLTRINHARRLAQFLPLGYIAPVLYDLQKRGTSLCRDITVGNNTCNAVTGYAAQTGYDQVTGWGSPLAPAWFNELAWGAPKP